MLDRVLWSGLFSLIIFRDLHPFNRLYPYINEYQLQPPIRFQVLMTFSIELYNTDGDTTKDIFSVIVGIIYLCFLGLWVSICFKNQTYVHKIHILMGALLVVVTIDLICGPADPNFMKIDGGNVVFYPIKFTRVVLFFTVVVLIGAGWSFMRSFLPLKDRIVFLLVILLNVASILLWEINPFHQDRQTWASWVFAVDVVCWFCLLLFPICGTRIWLGEVCYGDARNFAKIEEELTWFDKAFLLAFFYFYHWRLGVGAARGNPSPPYPDVVLSKTEEIFSFLFCMAIFYMLRPRVHQYYFLHIEDEIEGIKTDRVSFSYPKLPEDFEWSS